MALTYTIIENQALTSSHATVTFSSIPQTYTDLVLFASAMSNVSTSLAGNYNIEFNGVTSSYSGRRLYADPGGTQTPYSDTGTPKWGGFVPGSGAAADVPNSCFIYIANYSSNTQYKAWSVDVVVETNTTSGYLGLGANLWSNTNPITSIAISGISSGANTGSFIVDSNFTLYGIKDTV